MEEVSRFECGECKYFGEKCKCIDHTKVHFGRSCFSSDIYTYHHTICTAFEPTENFPAVCKEWERLGGFWNWHKLFVEQWLGGKAPKEISIIFPKALKEGREVTDDVLYVPYEDFLNCEIMREDGIHYTSYRHIEISRKNVTGYKWFEEEGGVWELE